MDETAQNLTISYIGREISCAPGETLTFGREADIVIDENPYLHRVAGIFRFTEGMWLIENVGSRTVLTLRGADRPVSATIPPGQLARLIDPTWTISFRAGPTTYELEGSCSFAGTPQRTTPIPSGSTQVFGDIELTASQRLAVVALAQQFLRGDLSPSVPSNKEIAQQLGWTPKAVQRKVDNLADKLTQAGLRGLKGQEGASAERRRERIAEHMVRQQIVGVDDLALLPSER